MPANAPPAPESASKDDQAPRSQPGMDGDAAAATRAERKVAPPTSLDDFIRRAYAGRKRLVLQRKTEKTLSATRLDERALTELLELGKTDPVLQVPKQLLLAIAPLEYGGYVRVEIRQFVRAILDHHPVFQEQVVSAAIRNTPESPPLKAALLVIRSQDFSSFVAKKREQEQLRLNALQILLLWFAEERRLTVSALLPLMNDALWRGASPEKVTRSTLYRSLIEPASFVALETVYAEMLASEGALRKEAATARAAAESARDEVSRLQSELNASDEKVRQLQEEVMTVRNEFASAAAEAEAARGGLHHDLELRRTRVLRRLKSDVALLEAGLIAIRRDPPKVAVMDDHAERVADSLRQEIAKLEGEQQA